MTSLVLSDRAVIEIDGADAAGFLQGLVTGDIERLADGASCAAALLTPQGKVLFEMIAARCGEGYLLDCHAGMADDLAKRLGFYRLRARVGVALRGDMAVLWEPGGTGNHDPRLPALGSRTYGAADTGAEEGTRAYHDVRIAAGVAEAGADYDPDSVFPHEANLDLLGAVSFAKGCFIGQEVVSRMEHRGTARKRFVPFTVEGEMPGRGTDVAAGERVIGTVGSSCGTALLALVRLDRLGEAEGAGTPVVAGAARLVPRMPDWLAAARPARASA